MSETYSVELARVVSPLVAGHKGNLTLIIRYQRSQQPEAWVRFRVECVMPKDLTITPTSWADEQRLTKHDAGFAKHKMFKFDIPEDAVPGDREITVTITLEHGEPVRKTVSFKINKKAS